MCAQTLLAVVRQRIAQRAATSRQAPHDASQIAKQPSTLPEEIGASVDLLDNFGTKNNPTKFTAKKSRTRWATTNIWRTSFCFLRPRSCSNSPDTAKPPSNTSSDSSCRLSDDYSDCCCGSSGLQVPPQSMPLPQGRSKSVADRSNRASLQRSPETGSIRNDALCTHSDSVLLPWKLTRRRRKCVLLRTGNGFLRWNYPSPVIEWNDSQTEIHWPKDDPFFQIHKTCERWHNNHPFW